MIFSKKNASDKWFEAAQATGDYMGIRYGRKATDEAQIDWSFICHIESDGIGGFARFMKENGVEDLDIPNTKHTNRKIIQPLWKYLRRPDNTSSVDKKTRDSWKTEEQTTTEAPSSVSTHLFNEKETEQIRQYCRDKSITVNTFLLKHLDNTFRIITKDPSAKTRWMIPVNLRGDITRLTPYENHVSCIEPTIKEGDSYERLQQHISQRLQDGEHRATHLILLLGKLLSKKKIMHILKNSRQKTNGNIGVFSNLGAWDSKKEIDFSDACFFCPPISSGTLFAAGCLTFQNRMSLCIQTHPNISTNPETTTEWMQLLLNEVETSLPPQ